MPDVAATLRSIAESRRDDPLRPVTVIAPSHAAGLQMRRRLAELGPFAAVRFETFPRLAELLGAGHLAAAGRSPLARPIGDYLAGQVALQSGGGLQGVNDLPGYARVLRQMFRRLRRGGIVDSSDILGNFPVQAREIFRLYDLFREASAAFYDEEDLLDAAAQVVESRRAGALADIGSIYVAPPGALTAAGTRFLEALRTAAPAFEEIEENSARPATQRFVLAPDPASEARCVVREVLGALADGVPLHEIGVFHGADATYGRLLRETFAAGGVNAAPLPGVPLIETRAGRGVLALAELPAKNFSRAAAMELLSIAPLKDWLPTSGDRVRLMTNAWDRLSREAGVTRGRDAWGRRLSAFVEDRDGRLEGLDPETDEARIRAITYERDDALRLRDVVAHLVALLEPLRDRQDATAFIHTFKAIVREYFDPVADAIEQVTDEIDQLGTVGAVGGDFSLESFTRALRANLELATTRERGLGDGVVIAEYRVAGGLQFQYTILCGAFEGALPAGPGGDAILDDRVWQRLKVTYPHIDDATTRITRAREAAARAIATAASGQLTWTAPSYQPGGAREYYASPLMAEAYSAAVGRRVTAAGLRAERSSDIASHPGSALGSMLSGPVVDQGELVLREAVRSVQSGAGIVEGHPRWLSVQLLRGRRSDRFTEWDGNLGALAGAVMFGPSGAVSPTSLENYGACGYKYFARSVLRLNTVEEPDEREMMDAAERGTLIHHVLERFFREQQAQGRPKVRESWTPEDAARLVAIAREELERAQARGLTGLAIYAHHESRTIVADLEAFLREDSLFRAETGAIPTDFEVAIPHTNIAGVTLRGRVDRVDRTPDGHAAWVIDYKSGSTYEVRDMKDRNYLVGGRKLQLPSYLAVAGDSEAAQAMYWFITQRGEFKKVEYPDTPENRARFEATLTAILEGIRAGSFPPVPDDEDEWHGAFKNCGYCEFDRICSRRRDLEFQAKSGDDARKPWHNVATTAGGVTDDD
ncbi:MAG: PD-(D/E)XK nuclease family protein [Dehalococcoidia bacterium]